MDKFFKISIPFVIAIAATFQVFCYSSFGQAQYSQKKEDSLNLIVTPWYHAPGFYEFQLRNGYGFDKSLPTHWIQFFRKDTVIGADSYVGHYEDFTYMNYFRFMEVNMSNTAGILTGSGHFYIYTRENTFSKSENRVDTARFTLSGSCDSLGITTMLWDINVDTARVFTRPHPQPFHTVLKFVGQAYQFRYYDWFQPTVNYCTLLGTLEDPEHKLIVIGYLTLTSMRF